MAGLASQTAWAFLRALPSLDLEAGLLLVQVLRHMIEEGWSDLSPTELSNVLEEIGSPLSLDDSTRALRAVGLLSADGTLHESFPVDGEVFSVSAFRELLHPSVGTEGVDAWEIQQALGRCAGWARDLAEHCRQSTLVGVPPFWICDEVRVSDLGGSHTPLARDVGSTATLDVLGLWAEGNLATASEGSEGLVDLLEVSLRLQGTSGWYKGALCLETFDDDFVYNFEHGLGSCPTVDSAANACSAWCALLETDLSDELRKRVCEAIVRGIDFVLRTQTPNGSWAIHRVERDGDSFPPRDLSMRYAIMAITDALQRSVLDDSRRRTAIAALEQAASYLARTCHRNHASWGETFHPDASDDCTFETTAVLLQPLARLHAYIPEPLVDEAAAFVAQEYADARPEIVRRQFRVPTWHGISDEVVSWELPADALVATGLLETRAIAHCHAPVVRRAVVSLLNGERHGHWNDLVMAAAGKKRAFVSNSLLCARALGAWRRRTLDDLDMSVGRLSHEPIL